MLAERKGNPNDSKAMKQPRIVTFLHFRRLLRYSLRHKRYLLPTMLCILLVAVTYSASIGSILPVLTVMIQEDGLHGQVHRYILRERLRCELSRYRSLGTDAEAVPDGAARVTLLKESSALHAGGVREGDYISGVDGEPANAFRISEVLSGPRREHTLTVHRTTEDAGRQVSVTFPALGLEQRAMFGVVGVVPGGTAPEDRWESLKVVLTILFVIVIVGSVARVISGYLIVLINTRVIIDIRREMFYHVLRLPMSRFSESTADKMSMFVQDMNDVYRGLMNFFQKVVMEPFKAIGVVAFALYLDWRLTLFAMLGAPFLVVLFRKFGKRIRRANKKLLIGYGLMMGRLKATLTGMRVVKAYTRENYERLKMLRIDRNMLRQQLHMGFIEALTSPFMELVGFMAAAAAILYFGHRVLFQDTPPQNFIAMLGALAAIFDPIRKLSTVYPKLQRANAAAARIFELIDSPCEYDNEAGKPDLSRFSSSIEFDHVTFTYPGKEEPAVRDFTLTVKKGETVAIVGPNGSGKTTALSLLVRFFAYDKGHIRIDGQDIMAVSLHSLRKQFSLITQESVIFPDTVRANIAYGRPNATPEEIEAASRQAFADEFIREMPRGYDAALGEEGANLSGGQRQRIAIARSILRNAPILIFDEATSQVDPDSERKIHRALESFLDGRTAFIIAHRYSTIRNADRIVVMDDGRIADVGTHDQLFASCPLYRRLYENQFGTGD